MNTLSVPHHPSRPFPLLALAMAVLLAHLGVLAWLLFTPAAQPNKPEQHLEWVTLQKQPQVAAAAPKPPAPAPVATPSPARAPARQPARAKTEPQHAPAQRAPVLSPAPKAEHHASAQPPTPALAEAVKPDLAPAASPTSHPAEPAATPGAPRPSPSASSAGGAAPAPPVVETAASYQAEYLDNPPPTYPQLSRQLGEEGTVLLKVQVGSDGRPLQIKLLSSSGFSRLDASAEATVAQWRFVAATRNGHSVSAWVLVPIKFRILH